MIPAFLLPFLILATGSQLSLLVSAQLTTTVYSPFRIVLIGDSSAAGNGAQAADGLRNYEPGNECYRSVTSWEGQYRTCLRDQMDIAATYVNQARSGSKLEEILLGSKDSW